MIRHIMILIVGVNCNTVEMDILPAQKTCILELFSENQPISIQARVTEKPMQKYSVYITIENEDRVLLGHQKYDIDRPVTVLVHNNDKQ